MKWVQIIHNNATAEIWTNRNISKSIKFSKGCWQGCPLSPLLFTLAIEPLALAIRLHPQFYRIKVGPTEHRISLHADDIVLFLPNIKKSIPTLLELRKSFGDISGYKVNKTKSSILLQNATQRKYLVPEVTQFNVVEQFKHLGV